MSEQLLDTLDEVFHQSLSITDGLDDAEWRQQFHPDLSPAGWHIGHLSYVESYWIREVLTGDRRATAALEDIYLPWRSAKPTRGQQLPARAQLQENVVATHRENVDILRNLLREPDHHELLRGDYLLHFLIQHYDQHCETLHQILQQRALQGTPNIFPAGKPLSARQASAPNVPIAAAVVEIGSDRGRFAYDNEFDRHEVSVRDFHIAQRPVSNAEYLGFMEADGYEREEFWSAAGRSWLQTRPAHDLLHAPQHWRRDFSGYWYALTPAGPAMIDGDAAVSGINYYEAEAFARYAGARLPHETEWEYAIRRHADSVGGNGQCWEWCANTFYPYPGFRPFPYDNYSRPWFDEQHYSLRGGSAYTSPRIRRSTFRNFYQADKRHIFAGLRLAA